MTQADRIHAALQQGPVTSTDFLNPTDGGPPILRVAARIYDLRERGHHITETRNANGTSTYQLILTAGTPTPPMRGAPETVPSSPQPPSVGEPAAAMAPPPHTPPSGAGEQPFLFDVAAYERPGWKDAA